MGLHVGKNFLESYPDRAYMSHLYPLMNEAGRLGEKTKKGFYRFDRNRRGMMVVLVRGISTGGIN